MAPRPRTCCRTASLLLGKDEPALVEWWCGVQGAESMRKNAWVTWGAPVVHNCHIEAGYCMLHCYSASCCRCGGLWPWTLCCASLAASALTSVALMPA